MKKRIVFVIFTLALFSFLLTSGCGTKRASYVGKLFKNENTATEEAKEAAEYKSLIEKYVSKSGEPYKAHDYMLKSAYTVKYSEEHWLDSDGKIRLPFNAGDIAVTEQTLMEYYYIPDDIAIKASTSELADIFINYGYNGGHIPVVSSRQYICYDYEHDFDLMLTRSNALEESLRRQDFAKTYYEKYIAESDNMPEQYKEKNYSQYFELSNKTYTLDVIEVLLAQPEAYEQLADEQREMLIRRVMEREKQGEEGKLYFHHSGEYWTQFFACIAGEMYLPADMAAIPDTTGGLKGITGAIKRDNNPWLDTINRMKFTEEEQEILEKYFVRR